MKEIVSDDDTINYRRDIQSIDLGISNDLNLMTARREFTCPLKLNTPVLLNQLSVNIETLVPKRAEIDFTFVLRIRTKSEGC